MIWKTCKFKSVNAGHPKSEAAQSEILTAFLKQPSKNIIIVMWLNFLLEFLTVI